MFLKEESKMARKEFTFLYFLYILAKWRELVISSILFVSTIAVVISFILPRWYTSSTTILPPTEENAGLGLSSLLSSIPMGGLGTGLGLNTLSEEANLFLAILNSRTVMEAVINKFDLQNQYKVKTVQEAVNSLRDNISIKINEEGTITFSVEASTSYFPTKSKIEHTKLQARDMSHFFLDELEKTNKKIKVEKARNTRIFIEKRYNQNIADLTQAEEKFKDFQKKTGAIDLPEQTKALISAAAEIKAKIMLQKVSVAILRNYLDASNVDMIKAEDKLHELEKTYNEFKYGSNDNKYMQGNASKSTDIFLPLDKVPEMGVEYLRLYREVKLQEKMMEFLLPQYEQAKIQEAKDTPTVQVLDPPIIPELKTRPKRAILVIIAAICSFFLLSIILSLYERTLLLKEADPNKYDEIMSIIAVIKRDNKKQK